MSVEVKEENLSSPNEEAETAPKSNQSKNGEEQGQQNNQTNNGDGNEKIVRNSSARRTSSVHISRRTSSIMEANPDIDEDEYNAYKTPGRQLLHQIYAMVYRRWINIKRTIVSVIINMIITLIVSCLTIVVQLMLKSLISDSFKEWKFTSYDHPTSHLAVVADDYEGKWWQKKYVDAIKFVYKQDTGSEPDVKVFSTVDEINTFARNVLDGKEDGVDIFTLGFILPTEYDRYGGNNLTVVWNDTTTVNLAEMTSSTEKTLDFGLGLRVEVAMLTMAPSAGDPIYDAMTDEQKQYLDEQIKNAKLDTPATLNLIETGVATASSNSMFAFMAPMLISAGLLSITMSIIPTPVAETQGAIRNYMVSCSLSLIPYWVVTFIFDFIVYEVDVLLIWLLFIICQIEQFTDIAGTIYYLLFIVGPCFILYTYCISFIFNNPNNAARNAYLIDIVLVIIPFLVMMLGVDMNDAANSMDKLKPAYWIYSLFPPMLLEGYMQTVFMEAPYTTEGISHYFKSESTAFSYSIFVYIDIVIYAVILMIIERYRKHVQQMAAQSSFGNYDDFFKEQKAKHPVTPESDEMAKEVANNHDYAVRIENVSRLFFNTEGKPIPAVNCVSLGVKKGSIFGFLGANGAGKTTLISMITSMLPMSAGTIEINGKDITKENDPTILSVCPQFNTHLCMDMTISEHFHFYSLLHCMSKDQEKRNSDRLISLLDLDALKDTPIRELSEGDIRKLSIALSFLGRAQIILLDEPTATLDPVSMTQVHEMMLYYKGKKTFMLCTHLLSEAEALCDMISIMIKGNVYTCGSPQYLSAKFGTEYKIDLMLKDATEVEANKVDEFISKQVPQASLNIKRPTARIYNVPANSILLHELFAIMEEGKEGDNGYSYYTCSSSSLEKVFMEIVRMCEQDPDEEQNQ